MPLVFLTLFFNSFHVHLSLDRTNGDNNVRRDCKKHIYYMKKFIKMWIWQKEILQIAARMRGGNFSCIRKPCNRRSIKRNYSRQYFSLNERRKSWTTLESWKLGDWASGIVKIWWQNSCLRYRLQTLKFIAMKISWELFSINFPPWRHMNVKAARV